jgi:RNA polymerase sigma-70 factor (ECF subfamily)
MDQSLPEQLCYLSQGDESAFRWIVNHFGDRLYQFALGMVKSHHDAEEVVSDVFLKIWQLRKHLPDSEQFLFYLYRAVKHTSLNYLKKKNRKSEIEGLYTIGAAENNIRTPEDMVISKENIANIQDAINALPARCRQIFVLVKEDDLSYRQVAELLDISPATVNVQMTIAMKKLWQALDIALQRSHS